MNFKLITSREIPEDKRGSKFLGVNSFPRYSVSVNLEGSMLRPGHYYYMTVTSAKNSNDIRGWYIHLYSSYLTTIAKIDVNFFLSAR